MTFEEQLTLLKDNLETLTQSDFSTFVLEAIKSDQNSQKTPLSKFLQDIKLFQAFESHPPYVEAVIEKIRLLNEESQEPNDLNALINSLNNYLTDVNLLANIGAKDRQRHAAILQATYINIEQAQQNYLHLARSIIKIVTSNFDALHFLLAVNSYAGTDRKKIRFIAQVVIPIWTIMTQISSIEELSSDYFESFPPEHSSNTDFLSFCIEYSKEIARPLEEEFTQNYFLCLLSISILLETQRSHLEILSKYYLATENYLKESLIVDLIHLLEKKELIQTSLKTNKEHIAAEFLEQFIEAAYSMSQQEKITAETINFVEKYLEKNPDLNAEFLLHQLRELLETLEKNHHYSVAPRASIDNAMQFLAFTRRPSTASSTSSVVTLPKTLEKLNQSMADLMKNTPDSPNENNIGRSP